MTCMTTGGMEVNDYYGGFCVREICHAVKSENLAVRQEAVAEIAGWYLNTGRIGEGHILVPVPQHYGRADYTLDICKILAEKCGCKIADILRCIPHRPLYEQKKNGGIPFTGLYRTGGRITPSKQVYLIDNVIASGLTMSQCMRLVPEAMPFAYAKTKEKKGESLTL